MRLHLAVPAALALVASASDARTLTVHPDGGGETGTIQAALDLAAPGDTVLVACGRYFETALVMKSGVLLRSQTGSADCVTVDAGGTGRGILCESVDGSSEICGLTFTNGRLTAPCADPGLGSYCMGAGMLCVGSSPVVRNCAFVANESDDNGGGVTCAFSSPTFIDCEFRGNSAHVGGGLLSAFPPGHPTLVRCVIEGNAAVTDGAGVYVFDTSLTLSACTVSGNTAGEDGGGVFWISPGALVLDHTIVSFSPQGEAVHCGVGASVPQLSCCDLFGNAGGDWTGCVAGQLGVARNFTSDPQFCDPELGVYTLDSSSPCAPPGACNLVGAFGVGCVTTETAEHAVRSSSWGAVKAAYR